MSVVIRFDDSCKNGCQSFAITADVYKVNSWGRREFIACGCMHDDISKVFPELKPLIKWHLVSSDEPMHYIANTLYRAGDRDYNGLRKGEFKQLRNGKTGMLSWKLEASETLPQYVDSDTQPMETAVLRYVPWGRIGEGKERDLAAARDSAVWLDATDEQLSLPPEELKALLIARLPGLMEEFKADMVAAGFLLEPEHNN